MRNKKDRLDVGLMNGLKLSRESMNHMALPLIHTFLQGYVGIGNPFSIGRRLRETTLVFANRSYARFSLDFEFCIYLTTVRLSG